MPETAPIREVDRLDEAKQLLVECNSALIKTIITLKPRVNPRKITRIYGENFSLHIETAFLKPNRPQRKTDVIPSVIGMT
jgi:hypothetical protein